MDDILRLYRILPAYGRSRYITNREEQFSMPLNREGHFTTVDGIPVRKLFIGNLANETTERDLLWTFQNFGQIVDAIVKPPTGDSNRPTFGFVTYCSPAEASRALRKRHSLFVSNQKVYVFPADSWHQPLELPNGTILWDRRKVNNFNNANSNVSFGYEVEANNTPEVSTVDVDLDCQISKLNDDCLLLIFDCLNINERLILNKVCRRWKMLNMRMWHALKKLDFTVPPLTCKALNDRILDRYLSLCPNISHLNIAQDEHKLSTSAIVIIGNCCKKLETISIRDISIQKRSLAFLAKSCPLLRSFSMDACSTQHDNEMIALVKNCPALESISLKYSSSSLGLWLRFLQPPLKSVSLEMYEFDPSFLLEGIKNARPTLKELKFVSCDKIRCQDVENIASILPELDSLTFAGGFIDFSANALIPITWLKNLARLDLDTNACVNDHFLNELSQQCQLLNYLNLSGIDDRNLTLQGLAVLSQFVGLTHLKLACINKLNNAILKSLSHKIINLKHLDLMGCSSITDEGCQSIVSNCKDLEILDVSGCTNVTNLTVTTAIETISKRAVKKKLKIIAGESGIDVDVCWSSEVEVDPSSSIMSHYPGAMIIIDPDSPNFEDFDVEDEEDDFEDLYDEDDDDDSIFDGIEPYGFIHISCNDSDSDISNPNWDCFF